MLVSFKFKIPSVATRPSVIHFFFLCLQLFYQTPCSDFVAPISIVIWIRPGEHFGENHKNYGILKQDSPILAQKSFSLALVCR